MPWGIVRTGNGFGVKNKDTGAMKSHDIPKERAESQMRLLQAIKHGWVPSGSKRTNAIAH